MEIRSRLTSRIHTFAYDAVKHQMLFVLVDAPRQRSVWLPCEKDYANMLTIRIAAHAIAQCRYDFVYNPQDGYMYTHPLHEGGSETVCTQC